MTKTEARKLEWANGQRRRIFTLETRLKMSKAHLGKKLSKITKERLSLAKKGKPNGLLGRKYSLKHRKNISDSLKGKTWDILNRKMSEETKRKISLARKGKKPQDSPNWKPSRAHLGKKFSKEVRIRMSIGARKVKPNLRTKLTESIRKSIYYKLWREAIFTRDNWTCQACGIRGKVYLNADHYPIPFSIILDKYGIDSFKKALNYAKLWDINNGRTLCIDCHRKTPTYLANKNQMKERLSEIYKLL